MSGDVEEGVAEEDSDTFPQGCSLDENRRPDRLGGAGAAEA